jgi:hypothetical protein
MGRTTNNISVRSGDAAVVGVVALGLVGLSAVVAIVALVTVALAVVATVGIVALTVVAGVRWRRYQADAQAALRLWRRSVQVAAEEAPSEALRHAALVQLSDPPTPRVALAMRKMETPLVDETRPAKTPVTWRSRP